MLKADPVPRALPAVRPDVQGLRAVAVLLVILFHAGLPVPGGFVGVDVFFVISGFVITRLLWAELKDSNTLDLRRFYTRRVRRLGPALALVLVIVGLAALLLQNPLGSQQVTAKTGAAAAVFIANAALFELTGGYFDAPTSANPLLHTWTLSVEEQFYLMFPALLLAAWHVRRRSRTMAVQRGVAIAAIGAVLLVSLAGCVYMTTATGPPFGNVPTNNHFAFFGSPTRAWEFAAGSLLAIAELRLMALPRLLGPAAAGAGAALVLASGWVLDERTAFPGAAALLPVAGASLLLFGGSVSNSTVSRALGAPVMRWIGDRSYGWYLWHWPFIVFTRAIHPGASAWWLAVAAALSMVPTALSYHYVENPIRRNRRIRGRRALALAAACVLLPVAVFGVLFVSAEHPIGAVAALKSQGALHVDLTHGCTANLPGSSATTGSCTWAVPNARGTVLLLGDSNAGHFAEPVIRAAGQMHLNVTLATFGGCPFADVISRHDETYDEAGCIGFIQAWTDEVARARPTMVILGNASSKYVQAGSGLSLTAPGAGAAATSTGNKQEAWEAGLHRTLVRWSAAGVHTLIVHTVPHFNERTVRHFGGFDMRLCPTFRILAGNCGVRAARRVMDQDLAPARDAEIRATTGIRNALTLDVTKDVCPHALCLTNEGNRWIYRDGEHLTVPFSLTLAPSFLSQMQELAKATTP